MGKRIKATEVYENRFYRIPKAFFKTDKYKDMSLEAKVLYGFLDDRRELSLKNKWIDDEGYIFLIFTRKEIQEMLCLSDKPVTRAFKQLKEYGLIDEARQGLNKPNLIYVCHIDFTNIENMRTRQFSDSEYGDNTIQGSEDLRCIDTELNKTDISDTDKDIYIIFPNDVHPFFFLYNEYFKEKFKKEHMRLREKQYDDLLYWCKELQELGVDDYDFEEAVIEHFKNLASNNNGNMLAFMKASHRWFEVLPEDYVKNTPNKRKAIKGNFNKFDQRPYDGSDGGLTIGEIENKLLGWEG